MKIIKNPRTTLKIILLSTAIVIVGVGAYLIYQQTRPVDQSAPSKQSPVTDAGNKQGVGTPAGQPDQPTSDKTTNQVPTSKSMSIKIDSLAQQNGSIVYSGTVTNPDSGGSCSAVFTSTINKPISQTPAYKDGLCGPSTIPSSEFTSVGIWTLTLRYYTKSSQTSASKDIEIH